MPEYTESALKPGGGAVYSLPDLIDRAEKQNPDARGAWEGVQSAAALVGIARSQLIPTLALSAYALRGDTLFGLPPNVGGGAVIKLNSTILEASLQASYSVDLGTSLNAYRATKHLLASQKASLNQTNQQVALDTSTKYYDFLSAKESHRVALANEEDSCLNLKYSEEQLRNGLTTIISLRQARAKYLSARASSLSSVAKEADAKVSLASLLGLPPEQSFDVAPLGEAPPQVQLLTESLETLRQHALAKRPEIVESTEEIEAAHNAVRAAWAKYLPTFSFTAQGSYTDSMGNINSGSSAAAQAAGTDTKGPTYLFAGSMKFSIFDGGATRNGVKAARATERKLRDSADKSRLQVEQDVSKSYNDVLSGIESQDAAAESLAAAKDSWDSAKIARGTGLKSDVDLSSALLIYTVAQAAYTEARLSLLKSATQLAHATGNLLSTGAQSPVRIEKNP